LRGFYNVEGYIDQMDNIMVDILYVLVGGAFAAVPLYILSLVLRNGEEV
jgi:cytochrome c oxidase assembly protein Cox11